MRVILKPAGLFILAGAMLVMVTLLVLRTQSKKLDALPETAPIAEFKSKSSSPVPLYDDPSKMVPINLTESGKIDWVHWAGNTTKAAAHKSGGNSVSALTLIAPQAGLLKEGERGPSRGILWADGDAAAPKSPVTYEALHVGVQNGFRFSVAPHDTNPHRLHIYVGGWKTGGDFDPRMSDGTPVKISKDEAVLPNHYYSRVYTVEFQPKAADRTLSIEWKMGSANGNISLQAVALE